MEVNWEYWIKDVLSRLFVNFFLYSHILFSLFLSLLNRNLNINFKFIMLKKLSNDFLLRLDLITKFEES